MKLFLSVTPKPGQPLLVAIGIVFLPGANSNYMEIESQRHLPVVIAAVLHRPRLLPPLKKPGQGRKKLPRPKRKLPKRNQFKRSQTPENSKGRFALFSNTPIRTRASHNSALAQPWG